MRVSVATVSIRARPIAGALYTPRRRARTARGMERDKLNVLLSCGDLQNVPKHGKGVVGRQPSGALSWEMNEQINLRAMLCYDYS